MTTDTYTYHFAAMTYDEEGHAQMHHDSLVTQEQPITVDDLNGIRRHALTAAGLSPEALTQVHIISLSLVAWPGL